MSKLFTCFVVKILKSQAWLNNTQNIRGSTVDTKDHNKHSMHSCSFEQILIFTRAMQKYEFVSL